MNVPSFSRLSELRVSKQPCFAYLGTVVLGGALVFSACGTGDRPGEVALTPSSGDSVSGGSDSIPVVEAPPADSPNVGGPGADAGTGEIPALGPGVEVGVGGNGSIDQRMIGTSETDATATGEAEGFKVRVEARDGELFPLSQDYDSARLNLTVEDGKVTAVRLG